MTTDTFDILALPHIRGLLAAIDAGDDSALLPLSDAIEEAEGSRAAGLRAIVRLGHRPRMLGPEHGGEAGYAAWKPVVGLRRKGAAAWQASHVWGWLADVLVAAGGSRSYDQFGEIRYPTRSAAFLALAAALS